MNENYEEPHGKPAGTASGVEKDLSDRKACWRIHDRIHIGEAEAEGNGQQPSNNAGNKDGDTNGERASDGGIVCFFRHMSCSIVISH